MNPGPNLALPASELGGAGMLNPVSGTLTPAPAPAGFWGRPREAPEGLAAPPAAPGSW